MEELAKVARQMLIDKAMAKKDDWGVHETHCCPDHGCKYGDDYCPVVLGLTKERNTHCEMCEYVYEHPSPLNIVEQWVEHHIHDGEIGDEMNFSWIDPDELLDLIQEIYVDPRAVAELGRKRGWFK